MIGCGTASVSAPPASGMSSAIKRVPSSARNRSAPGEALAASTSHVSVELSCMRPIMWQRQFIVTIGTW